MGLSDDDVREILRLIDESDLDELRVQTEGFSLHVRRAGAAAEAPEALEAPEVLDAPGPLEPPSGPPKPVEAAEPAEPAGPGPAGIVTIASPMLGVFYRAGAPGAEPFVDVGAAVGPATTVCIIEVMKMMNSVPAGVTGTVTEVLAANGTLVEQGDPLFRVRPS